MGAKEKVLDYLQKHGTITGKEANDIGVTCLRDAIFKLRAKGYNITMKKIYINMRKGSFYYSRYYLLGGNGVKVQSRWQRIKSKIKKIFHI